MPDKTFQVEVITPDRCAVSEDMVSLQVRASDGRLGVLHNHAPLIASLATGRLRGRTSQGKEKELAVGDGFLEVLNNQVKVLCDFADFPEEIDVKRAEEAKERARDRLKHRSEPDIDEARAEAALRRALVRLKLGGRA
jgi:F-type H+-transporting ATPase subunit epsilon